MSSVAAMEPTESDRSARAAPLAIAALIVLVLITFGRTVSFGYVGWDDQETIFQNAAFRPVTMEAFVDAWTTAPMAIYMPITRTAWATLAAIGQHRTAEGFTISVIPFRCFSLAMHLASTLLVFAIARRLLRGATVSAFIGAAVFAVHPIQVEAVAWISGEKDLLAGVLSLAAMSLVLHGPSTRSGSVWLFASWLAATLAMLAKPQSVTVPLTLAILLVASGVRWQRAIALVAPLFMIAAIVTAVGVSVQTATLVDRVPIFARPLIALDAVGWYVGKLLVPTNFLVDYGRNPAAVLSHRSAWLLAALALAASCLVILNRRRHKLATFGALIAIVGVVPVLGLVPFDFQYISTVTDHYAYASMAGIALAIAAIIARFDRSFVHAIAMSIVAVLAGLSFRQAGYWQTTETLFTHALAINPTSFAAHRVLAFEATKAGDDRRAVELLNGAIAIHPRDPIANFNLANALVRLGDEERAEAAFNIAITAEPRKAIYRHNYAAMLARHGRLVEAEAQLRVAIECDPTASESLRALSHIEALLRTK